MPKLEGHSHAGRQTVQKLLQQLVVAMQCGRQLKEHGAELAVQLLDDAPNVSTSSAQSRSFAKCVIRCGALRLKEKSVGVFSNQFAMVFGLGIRRNE